MNIISRWNQLPPVLLARFSLLWLRGRVHFPKNPMEMAAPVNEDFLIFRQAVVDPNRDQPQKPRAVLMVRFHFARFSLKINRILSLIPIPFILAQPGFRTKAWMFREETGEFQGLYEWDTVEDARSYLTSFPLELMKRRAIPESLTFEIRETESMEEGTKLDPFTNYRPRSCIQ